MTGTGGHHTHPGGIGADAGSGGGVATREHPPRPEAVERARVALAGEDWFCAEALAGAILERTIQAIRCWL